MRYVKFHPRATACECCGAALLKGAVELSDGRKYGRTCAARAMGRKREDSAMKREVERLAALAARDERHAAYVGLDRSVWKWQAKGYGGSAGMGLAVAYSRPDGSTVIEFDGDPSTLHAALTAFPDRCLGTHKQTGRSVFLLSADDIRGAGWPAAWTADWQADWILGKGWTS